MREAAKEALKNRGLLEETSYINQLIMEDLKRNNITIKTTPSYVGTLGNNAQPTQ
jgi:hypothetical protein